MILPAYSKGYSKPMTRIKKVNLEKLIPKPETTTIDEKMKVVLARTIKIEHEIAQLKTILQDIMQMIAIISKLPLKGDK